MKKIVLVIITILIFALGIIYINHDVGYITSDEAKQIAMDDVSNKDGEYFFNSVEFKETNDMYIYTLEFTDKVNMYTYKINAQNKKIISFKKESLTNKDIYIKEEEVLKIVFENAKLTQSSSNLISNEIIVEDDLPIYNTVFYNNNIKYKYKVNAYTGAIISITKLDENAV